MSRKDKNTKVHALQCFETSHISQRNMMHGHSVCLQRRVVTHIGNWKPITCLFVTNSREKLPFFPARSFPQVFSSRPFMKLKPYANVAAKLTVLLRQSYFVCYFLLHVRIRIKTLQGFESKCQVSFDLRTRSGEIMHKYA